MYNSNTLGARSALTDPPSAGDPPRSLGTCTFFTAILPTKGIYCLALPLRSGEGFKHHFRQNIDDLATLALDLDARGATAYHANASFKTTDNRKQTNVAFVKAFWLDIDCGADKPYPDKRTALKAVLAFGDELGIAQPLVVKSGNGLHVYWPLDRDLTLDQWKPIADLLKAACRAAKLQADPSRTSDASSILRPVGTHHRKGEPKEVVVVLPGEGPSDPDELRDALTAYVSAHGTLPNLPSSRAPVVAMNADLTDGIEHRASYSEPIAEKCSVVREMRDTRGNIDQPTWYGNIGVLAFTEDGQQFAHQWSDGHPKYTPAETDSKLAQARQFAPTTCAKMAESRPQVCAACPHNGKIKSPIVLGMEARASVIVPNTGFPASILDIPSHMDNPKVAIGLLNSICGCALNWGGQATLFVVRDGVPEPCSEKDLRLMLGNKWVQVGDKWVNAYPFFIGHPERRTVGEVGYWPHRSPVENVLNLWSGFALTPRKGKCKKMLRHILEVWCSGDRSLFVYVLSWLAHLVQRPGETPRTALIVMSVKEGTGKSIVVSWLVRGFGRHAISLNTSDHLLGRFNAFLEGKSLCAVNEAPFAGNHDLERKLKSIVADDWLTIERKFAAVSMIPNSLHLIVTTNEERAVAAGHGARRWCVLKVSPHRAGDHAYFSELAEEAENGGIEALFHTLLHLDISNFDPVRDMPKTEALRDQQLRSLSPHEGWALDLAEGLLPHEGAHAITLGSDCATRDLYSSYLAHARTHGARAMGGSSFGRWLATLSLTPVRVGGSRDKGWHIPDATSFTALVEKSAGIHP